MQCAYEQIRPLKLMKQFPFELSGCWPKHHIHNFYLGNKRSLWHLFYFEIVLLCYSRLQTWGSPLPRLSKCWDWCATPQSAPLSWVSCAVQGWNASACFSFQSAGITGVCPMPTDSWFKAFNTYCVRIHQKWMLIFFSVVELELSLPVMFFSFSQDQKNTLPSSNITLGE